MSKKGNATVVIAIIGAGATIVAAAISGACGLVAGLLQLSSGSVGPSTSEPTPIVMVLPTDRPTLEPVSGLVFATRITANGQAVDPDTTFPADITDLYAVFRSDSTPPGMRVNIEEPADGAYYAYLKVREDASLSTFGWRWYLNGEIVNEYQTEVEPGSEIWLHRFDYSGSGIFQGELSPGVYRVVILLGGNPALSADLTIEP